ncbi:MAG: hypothetical protein ABI432_16630 [Flavobacteriales bacterium]
MRTSFFILALVLAVQHISAQSIPPGEKEPAWVMKDDSLVGGLVLDTAQRRMLVDVERRYQRDFDTLEADDTLAVSVVNDRMKKLNARREQEIKSVMTPEQYAQWTRITIGEAAKHDH